MPTATGRYCDSCHNEVRDFTGMEPELVLQVLQQNGGSMCGLIEVSKVQYRPELHIPEVTLVQQKSSRIRHWYRMAAAAAATFLLLLSGKAKAQEIQKPVQETDSVAAGKGVWREVPKNNDSEKRSGYELKGRVTDAHTRIPIQACSVRVMRKGVLLTQVNTNTEGTYEVRLSSSQLEKPEVYVEFSSDGYFKKIVTDISLNSRNTRYLNVGLATTDSETREVDIKYLMGKVKCSEESPIHKKNKQRNSSKH